jgi:S1-C subfamily serine protease
MLSYLFKHKSPGDTVELTIIRNGGEMAIELVLGARP